MIKLRKIWDWYYPWILAVGFIVLVFAVGFTIKSCNSARENAAIQSDETKANQAADKALQHEGAGRVFGEQANAIDKQRVELEQRLSESKGQTVEGRKRLAERKKEYEQVKNSGPNAGGDLAERERRVLTKLRALYPSYIIERAPGAFN